MLLNNPIKTYEYGLRQVLQDRTLTSEELRDLSTVASRLNLSPRDVHECHVRVLTELGQALLQSNAVTRQSLTEFDRLLALLQVDGLELGQVRNGLAQYMLRFALQDGTAPRLDPAQWGIFVKPGEVVHFCADARAMEARAVARQFSGGAAGGSFRVAKGVSIRLGGFQGISSPITRVVPVASGRLVMTNRSVAFLADKKGFNVEWRKVSGFEPYTDGIRIFLATRSTAPMLQFDHEPLGVYAAEIANFYMNAP